MSRGLISTIWFWKAKKKTIYWWSDEDELKSHAAWGEKLLCSLGVHHNAKNKIYFPVAALRLLQISFSGTKVPTVVQFSQEISSPAAVPLICMLKIKSNDRLCWQVWKSNEGRRKVLRATELGRRKHFWNRKCSFIPPEKGSTWGDII